MILYPALDLRGGRIVRLAQGDYARETRYEEDPCNLALRYARDGARWLHLVDLDGARDGGYRARETLSRIARDSGLQVQTGGGVRDREQVRALLDAGAARVVLGSVALREPARAAEWLQDFGAERICLALDVRATADGTLELPAAGWLESTGQTLFEYLDAFCANAPLRHLLCTDIARDGMLAGPALGLYQAIASRYPLLQLQASGGVRDARDIEALRAKGVAGAIVGKALLDGRVSLPELLAC